MSLLAARVLALEAAFRRIAATRMAGLPLMQPGLAVQAVGFEPEPDDAGLAWGVLITPWFMNLLRLPLMAENAQRLPAPGVAADWTVGGHAVGCLGAEEALLGPGPLARYALCSLHSPMHHFADQASALAAAREVLQLLRPAAAQPVSSGAPVGAPPPSRRGFLFGRGQSPGTP